MPAENMDHKQDDRTTTSFYSGGHPPLQIEEFFGNLNRVMISTIRLRLTVFGLLAIAYLALLLTPLVSMWLATSPNPNIANGKSMSQLVTEKSYDYFRRSR